MDKEREPEWQQQIIRAVRETAASLCRAFEVTSPVNGLDELRKTFHRVNGTHEKSLRARLREIAPDTRWVADDLAAVRFEPGTDEAFWVCDVIDGAVQFFQGIPAWCLTLGRVVGGVVTFALTLDPIHDVLYVARPGEGTWRNGQRAHVGTKTALANALVATNQAPFVWKRPEEISLASRSLNELLARTLTVRSFGPTSLQIADVASGRIDVFWQFGEDSANCLAAALMAREAGALVVDARGEPWTERSSSIVVGNAALVAELLTVPSFGRAVAT